MAAEHGPVTAAGRATNLVPGGAGSVRHWPVARVRAGAPGTAVTVHRWAAAPVHAARSTGNFRDETVRFTSRHLPRIRTVPPGRAAKAWAGPPVHDPSTTPV